MDKQLTARAAVGNGMTLDELGRFVQQAMRDGATGDEKPTVRIAFGGGIKTISVTITATARENTKGAL